MENITFYLAGNTRSLHFAGQSLSVRGIPVADTPSPAVTHLLLPVPSFAPDGQWKGDGKLSQVLDALPADVTVIGGNLKPELLQGRKYLDLLQDDTYLAQNAALTAEGAVRMGAARLNVSLKKCPVLVIGWGRIGKCLAGILKSLGADVTVAARKPADRAMLTALGYRVESPDRLNFLLLRYRLIYNTVPAPILAQAQLRHCRSDAVLMDLASVAGMQGGNVLWARGIPEQTMPESAGALIAAGALRLLAGKGVRS